MKYNIPEQMPSRNEFLTLFLDAVFPDLDALGCTKTGYGYTSACEQAAKETGLLADELDEVRVEEDSSIFRLMFELAESSESIFGKTPPLLEGRAYERYSDTLFSFCDRESGSLKGWLKPSGSGGRFNKSFDAALFFSFLLLNRRACAANRRPFFEKCLEYVGITDIDGTVAYKLFDFDRHEPGERANIDGREFARLDNRAAILFGTTALTVFELIGTYSADRDRAKLQKLYDMFDRIFKDDIAAFRALKSAETAFFNSNKFFDPRSIQTAKKLYPQDFYVLPEFELDGETGVMPFSAIKSASKSNRLLITAKTGLGKSAFLQMASLCMLYERCGSDEASCASLQKIAERLDVPDDMFIISVPARMFSFCFKDERYRDWTTDFVTLFFNCMWKLSDGFNFYSTQNSQRFVGLKSPEQPENFEVTKELTDYIRELARTGKLLLILDSFDEISSREMRTAYLNTLTAFCDRYCRYPEANEVGAHVIVSSREMSPKTMNSLANALETEQQSNRYGICPLNEKQRGELVMKWNRFSNIPDEESHEILKQIENNHYYLDYSVNPYMLSVVCFYFGHDLGSITQRFINTLVDRMIKNNRSADPVIQDVLMNIVKLLQDVAGETITNGNPHFSRQKLDRYLSRHIDKTDFTDDEIDAYIERLHEIFVTEVGLIVPADGADSDYQFINSQIRYELAAKGIQRALEDDDKTTAYRENILPSITNIEEYVGLLVPLLCDINLENVRLAELLVSDLAMYDFGSDADESVLIRTMLDLLLNRYGSNITTAANPGDKDAVYVRRAQRMILMRVLSSGSFLPSEKEKEELSASPAFRSNAAWFSENITSRLL